MAVMRVKADPSGSSAANGKAGCAMKQTDYDREAARRVLTLAAGKGHDWLERFIPILAGGYARHGYEWLWKALNVLERRYEPHQA